MSNLTPLRLDISPLPPNFTGSPQDIADAIEARAQILTDTAFSLFTVGPTAPTSDEGPWLNNGTTWWIWDVGTGAYIPQIIDPVSLRYGIFATASLPADDTDYDVVIEVNAGGVPLAVKIWYSGAWTDVYANMLSGYVTAATLAANYYTQAQTAAAIAAALTAAKVYQFRVSKSSSNQAYTGGSGYAQVSFDNLEYDPEGAWFPGTNVYIAPVAGYYEFSGSAAFALNTGTPTGVTWDLIIRKNGAQMQWMMQNDATPVNMELQANTQFHCNLNDTVDVAVAESDTGGSTWNIINSPQQTNFFGKLIKAD